MVQRATVETALKNAERDPPITAYPRLFEIQWEYQTVAGPPGSSELDSYLNAQGREGWQVFSVEEHGIYGHEKWYRMKRPRLRGVVA